MGIAIVIGLTICFCVSEVCDYLKEKDQRKR